METLGKLFGSEARIKIMRLFLFNPDRTYDAAMVVEKARVTKKEARKEMTLLANAGLIKKHTYFIPATEVSKRKKAKGWIVNENFSLLKEIQALLINTVLLRDDELIERLSKMGKVKLIICAGVFIQNWESRVDLLVVGDKLKDVNHQTYIRKIEADVGRELSYAVLEVPDFQYRLSVGDKLIRDVLDYPHKILLDKLGITIV